MRLTSAVDAIARELEKPELPPLLAAEAVKALQGIDSTAARQRLADYRKASPAKLQHRGANLVRSVLGEQG
jgi:hypothetical protein